MAEQYMANKTANPDRPTYAGMHGRGFKEAQYIGVQGNASLGD
jgi:hypothetical protein